MKIKEDWACSIIVQALMEIKVKADVQRVVAKVGCTAVGSRPDIMREFRKMVKMKEKTLM